MEFKNKVVYQIWPRSFKDGNNDGIGDLLGIIEKLDYLHSLGIDLIWLSPIYASPNHDYGYDVSDYYCIHEDYGTMEDFDRLLLECKKRGMNILMDLVANHTSDQHDWFQDCMCNPDSPYRDYYLFKDSHFIPNNWLSCFGGSAWQKDTTKPNSWYLTTFTPRQCDLNWENPAVRQEMSKIMRYWIEKGVAGFRIDVVNTIAKEPGLPSYQSNKRGLQFPKEYITNLARSHDYLQELIASLDDLDFITVGEGMLVDQDACALYAGADRKELDMMFMFDLHLQDCGPLGKYDFRKLYQWNIPTFKNIVYSWQMDMQERNYWMGNYLNNHDQPRTISRFGNDTTYRVQSAKAFALLNLTLRGTPFIYQGEEIGMTNCPLEIKDWRDFEAINIYEVLPTMMHVPKKFTKKIVQRMTRDNARTPMQWDASKYAGFSSKLPWIKVNPNYEHINVKQDLLNKQSIIKAYQQLIQIRKEELALVDGDFAPLLSEHKSILAYTRTYHDTQLIILINLSSKVVSYNFPLKGEILFNNTPHYEKNIMSPYQALLVKVKIQ